MAASMTTRRRLAVTIASAASLVMCAMALGVSYTPDGQTTYCWAIPQPTSKLKLSNDDRTEAFSGDQCPMEFTIELSSYEVEALELITMNWTIVANFSHGNAVNNTELFFGPDGSNDFAHIVHSNVHTCQYGTGCDPFDDGVELMDKTDNKVANFSDNRASFSDSMRFPSNGEYSVLAHVILPDSNASQRFDYAVYTKVLVRDAPETPTPEPNPVAPVSTPVPPVDTSTAESSSALSTGAIVGIALGGVAVVVLLILLGIVLRRRHSTEGGYVRAPVTTPGTGKGLDPSDTATGANTNTTGFESAWNGGGSGGGGGIVGAGDTLGSSGRPTTTTVDLDGSNQSAGSIGSGYAYQPMGYQPTAYQPDTRQDATIRLPPQVRPSTRNHRQDDDIEL